MTVPPRPHLLGIDDGAFEKYQRAAVPIVGVFMEGCDLVEGVATTRFPVDGADATAFLADWICGLRFHRALQGIVVGGITIAGLGVLDIRRLHSATEVPVLVVNRKRPTDDAVVGALRSAGLEERIATVENSPRAFDCGNRLFAACAGCSPEESRALLAATLGKARLPEPLRLAHLIARAMATGESRGRV